MAEINGDRPEKPPEGPPWRGLIIFEAGRDAESLTDKAGNPVIDKTTKKQIRRLPGRNGYFMFAPERRTLRGRWKKSNLIGGEGGSDFVMDLPDEIPGEMVLLDGGKRRAVISDPLRTEPGKKNPILEMCDMAMAKFEGFAGYTVPDDIAREQMTDTQIKTWLWHLRQMVDCDMGRIVEGELPEAEQIKALPGLTQIQMNSMGPKKHYLEVPEKEPEYA